MVVQVPRRLRGGAADLRPLRLAAQRLRLLVDQALGVDILMCVFCLPSWVQSSVTVEQSLNVEHLMFAMLPCSFGMRLTLQLNQVQLSVSRST